MNRKKHSMPRVRARTPDGHVHYAGPFGVRTLCRKEHFAHVTTRLGVTCHECRGIYLYVHHLRLEHAPDANAIPTDKFPCIHGLPPQMKDAQLNSPPTSISHALFISPH